jgi:hypothetical protein
MQILGKAQSMAERLAQNKRRGEQLSLMSNMADEHKRNAKLIETQAAGLQVLSTYLGFSGKIVTELHFVNAKLIETQAAGLEVPLSPCLSLSGE